MLLHIFGLFEPQVFPWREAEKYRCLTYLLFLIPDFTTCSSWMDSAFAAYFAVNNACWDLVRRFGKRNCAKWKKGMCFSADERQIREGENIHINQNNGTTGQNMQR